MPGAVTLLLCQIVTWAIRVIYRLCVFKFFSYRGLGMLIGRWLGRFHLIHCVCARAMLGLSYAWSCGRGGSVSSVCAAQAGPALLLMIRVEVRLMTFPLFCCRTLICGRFIRIRRGVTPAFGASAYMAFFRNYSGVKVTLCCVLSGSIFRHFAILLLHGFHGQGITILLKLLGGVIFRGFKRYDFVSTGYGQFGILISGIRHLCFTGVRVLHTFNCLWGNFDLIIGFHSGVPAYVVVPFVRVWCYIGVRVVLA